MFRANVFWIQTAEKHEKKNTKGKILIDRERHKSKKDIEMKKVPRNFPNHLFLKNEGEEKPQAEKGQS